MWVLRIAAAHTTVVGHAAEPHEPQIFSLPDLTHCCWIDTEWNP